MRYRTRRSAWRAWAWAVGGLLGLFWPAALPLSMAGKDIAVAVWLASLTVLAVTWRVRRARLWDSVRRRRITR